MARERIRVVGTAVEQRRSIINEITAQQSVDIVTVVRLP